jgi:hypothetical protein
MSLYPILLLSQGATAANGCEGKTAAAADWNVKLFRLEHCASGLGSEW